MNSRRPNSFRCIKASWNHLSSRLRKISLPLYRFSSQILANYFIECVRLHTKIWIQTTIMNFSKGDCKSKMVHGMVMLLLIYSTCLVLVQRVEAADPDPLVDFSANATTPVFRNIFANGDVSIGSGGVRAALDIGKFPGLTYVEFSDTFLFCWVINQMHKRHVLYRRDILWLTKWVLSFFFLAFAGPRVWPLFSSRWSRVERTYHTPTPVLQSSFPWSVVVQFRLVSLTPKVIMFSTWCKSSLEFA